ncbi:hypothetical protein A6V29_02440 [Blastococcus sp. CCUG 61487]|nr:hypothetical protein A6V29_02440 [Blastococcus sp. CCUG 61487]
MWSTLAGAILCEVAATLALKAALDDPRWYVVVAVGYLSSFVLLGLTLRRGMPVGVAYGFWAAAGVVLTALLAAAIFGEPMTALMGVGIVLIIGGVLVVEMGAERARVAEPERS